MGFLRKYLDTKQVQENEIENLEQGGVPSVPSVPSELEFPARLDKNWSEEIEENEGGVFQEVFQGAFQVESDSQDTNLETLPQALVDWMLNPRTQGGDEWPIPEDLLPMFDDLVTEADARVRERDPRWRIQRGYKSLRLKAWVWDSEPPPYRRPKTKSRFGVRR